VKIPRWLLILLVLVICGVWVTSFIAGLVNPGYQPPESINLVFSAMVAALLAQLGRQNGGKGDDSKRDD
jgi:hypothetical protein